MSNHGEPTGLKEWDSFVLVYVSSLRALYVLLSFRLIELEEFIEDMPIPDSSRRHFQVAAIERRKAQDCSYSC